MTPLKFNGAEYSKMKFNGAEYCKCKFNGAIYDNCADTTNPFSITTTHPDQNDDEIILPRAIGVDEVLHITGTLNDGRSGADDHSIDITIDYYSSFPLRVSRSDKADDNGSYWEVNITNYNGATVFMTWGRGDMYDYWAEFTGTLTWASETASKKTK